METTTKQKNVERIKSAPRFTDAQLELINIFDLNLSDKDMVELKDMVAQFLGRLATREMDRLIDAGECPMPEKFSEMHLRTPYRKK